MERVGILINKLQEQFATQVESDQLLVTAQMLLAELQQHKRSNPIKSSVSVFVPGGTGVGLQSISMTDSPVAKSGTKKKEELSGWLFDMQTELPIVEPIVEQELPLLAAQMNEPEVLEKLEIATPVISTIPAKEVLELNDIILDETPMIHDQLKQASNDISTGFQETPIRDLKKAIGINDRYLFINELFRGDEIMYERSLKTINGFNIFPEAQYWIERELKLKLGWKVSSVAVEHFDQLVKRRFA